jgi:uncharacterized RDD family membrane protein YckC
MHWYYAEAGNRVGPIEEAELNRLVTVGTVRPDTLVWHEGLESWQPLGVVRGMPVAAVHAAARHYGGFWIRFVARLIDGMILGIINAIVRIPFMMMFGSGIGMGLDRGLRGGMVFGPGMAGVFGTSTLIGLALGAAYDVYFLSAHGATPGKMALGLRVIHADGGPISPMLALARHFAEWLSAIILMIGYIMAAFDPEKRALHDRICNTRVVYSR